MMKDEAVLLVDADLGRPAVHRLLRLPRSNGLGRLLDNPDDDPGRYVRHHQGLYLLEAGEATARTRSALASPLAQRVFQRLRQRFAYIVVDAPPVLTVAEGLILQRMVDSILLVVRARVTPRELVRRAVESLDLSRLAGILLNDVGGGLQGYGYDPYPYFDRGDVFDRGDAATASGGGA
jgi:Mrp family chromosome partitioning ATPase